MCVRACAFPCGYQSLGRETGCVVHQHCVFQLIVNCKWKRKGSRRREVNEEEEIIRNEEWEGERGSEWERTSMMIGEKYTEREREGYGNKGWKGTWQRRGADRDNMWQWNREIMADRFNEVFPDVILNCNYSALLSARVYMHVCAALNIPAELVWSRQHKELSISTWPGDILWDQKYQKYWRIPIYLDITVETLYYGLLVDISEKRQEAQKSKIWAIIPWEDFYL